MNSCLLKNYLNDLPGKYREGDENRLEKPPFAVCKDFSAAVEQICTMLWQRHLWRLGDGKKTFTKVLQKGNLSLSFSIVVVLSPEGDKQLKSGKLVADGALDTKQTLKSFDRSFSRWHHLTTAINFELSFLNRLQLREVRVRFSNLVTQ